MLLCSAWAWRDTRLNQNSDKMKSSEEGGHQIPQQQGTCTWVKKALKMRHLERKLGLANANCRNTVNTQEKKISSVWKIDVTERKLLGSSLKLQVDRQVTFYCWSRLLHTELPNTASKGVPFLQKSLPRHCSLLREFFPGRSMLSHLCPKHLTGLIPGNLKYFIQPKERYSTVPPVREI